jgi:hypothetical protein
MNRAEFTAWENRIKDRAEALWKADGSPEGPRDGYLEEARELIAIEENPDSGQLDPEEAAEPMIESLIAVHNQGEFPTLTDQGEEQSYPSLPDEDDERSAQ